MLIIWLILLVIGVFDARENKIPNVLVLLLLFTSILNSTSYFNGDGLFATRALAFVVMFAVWLPLYILRVAAAGDVKLAAVVGYIVGWQSLLSYCLYFTFCCFFIGLMYQLMEKATKDVAFTGYKPLMVSLAFKDMSPLQSHSTRMPLAPVMIIALAMQSYFYR